jgi:alkylation response protein AidB-like acyl-CoA dehydrogenase
MEFSLTAEQQLLQEATTAFAKKELNHNLQERDRISEFPREAWLACAEFGILGLPMPPEFGGREADTVTVVAVMEALGYGCRDNGLIFALNAQLWGVQMPILKFGTPEQRRAYLPSLIAGDLIGAHAVTEAESGSDVYSLHTHAELRHDCYILNGSKVYITNAPEADVMVVFATQDSDRGMAGISAFVVSKDSPGLTVSPALDKMGLRTATMGEVILTDCEVPVENRLGSEGSGMGIFNFSIGWERNCILASSLGAMRRQLETSISYANSRRQFGEAIGKFESISNKIADMYVRMAAGRLLIYQAAWLGREGKPAVSEAAAAKLFVSEAWVQSSLDAIQLHGAYGYMSEAEIERDLRDAVAGTIYSGTSEIQRVIIARMLGV